jgi:hypothetical protein
MRNLPWYLLGGMGIAVAVEGGPRSRLVWPLNILGGVFLFNAAYACTGTWTDGGIPRSRRTAVRADFGGTGALRPYTPTEHEAQIERVARHRRPLSEVVTL